MQAYIAGYARLSLLAICDCPARKGRGRHYGRRAVGGPAHANLGITLVQNVSIDFISVLCGTSAL